MKISRFLRCICGAARLPCGCCHGACTCLEHKNASIVAICVDATSEQLYCGFSQEPGEIIHEQAAFSKE